jgi:phosphoglycolate phosphatase-like HAD superfamily hydrolase
MTIEEILKQISTQQITDIIFDFDETICTLQIDWGAWSVEMDRFIRQFEPDFHGSLSHTAINQLTRRYGPEFRRALIEKNTDLEHTHYHGYTVVKQGLALLKAVAEECRVHLWTSNNRQTVTPVMKKEGIDSLFTSTVCYNDVLYIKPDPDGFRLIHTGDLPVSQFLFVGDSASDRGVCESLGIEFIDVALLR